MNYPASACLVDNMGPCFKCSWGSQYSFIKVSWKQVYLAILMIPQRLSAVEP